MGPPKKRTLGLWGKPSGSGNTCRNDVSTAPRLFIQVGKDVDGCTVSLHGYVGGRLVTLSRGLTEAEANERAETEAAERGLAVRCE
jgi:hypothetical protein